MYSPQSILLKNFKSFAGKHTLTFPQAPGLYSLTGKNKARPRMGGNAIGKSSLLDAIHWVFFGKTMRGQRANAVVNWRAKSKAAVVHKFMLRGKAHTISRGQSPNYLKLDGKIVAQSVVDKLLGIDSAAFCRIVIFGQFNDYFLDLSAAAKLAVFSHALRLSVWDRMAKAARNKAAIAEQKCNAQKIETGRIEGKLSAALAARKQTLKEYKRGRKLFLRIARDQKRNRLGIKSKLAAARVDLQRAAKAERKDRDACRRYKSRLASFDSKIKRHERARYAAERSKAELAKTLRAYGAEKEKAQNLGGVCPVCRGRIDTKDRREIAQHYQNLIDLADVDSRSIDKAFAVAVKRLNRAMVKEAAIREKLERSEDRISGHAGKISELKVKIAKLQQQLSASKAAIAPMPGKKAYRAACATARRLRKAHKAAKAVAIRLAGRAAGYQELAKAALAARLQLLEGALAHLNAATAAALPGLGLAGWRIVYACAREGAAGQTIRGFTVKIHPPVGKPAPWESWSGGEGQRLRLAGALGMADFLGDRAGFKSNVEFYDEPTAYVSAAGLGDLVQTLADRAADTKRVLWLVDHRALNAGDFAGYLRLAKTKAGSIFEEQQW